MCVLFARIFREETKYLTDPMFSVKKTCFCTYYQQRIIGINKCNNKIIQTLKYCFLFYMVLIFELDLFLNVKGEIRLRLVW